MRDTPSRLESLNCTVPAPNSDLPYYNRNSIPSIMRRRRFKIVNQLIEATIEQKGHCRILDIGGTDFYWDLDDDYLRDRRNKVTIILANIEAEARKPQPGLYESVIGDATTSELYVSHDYDLIHSNSVIEHVGPWPKVKAMADNIQASGRPYYIQTPNFWFPIEPHFRFVGFQFLPESTRAHLLMKKQRGFRGPAKDWQAAMDWVETVKLLTKEQLRSLFPKAKIVPERVGPFTKSFMVMGK